jgi:hypothetical protein
LIQSTEYNLSSLNQTLETGGTVIYRRKDITEFLLDLINEGYEVSDLNLFSGLDPLDKHVDVPPYTSDPHLKLRIEKYDCTSLGLIIRKPL